MWLSKITYDLVAARANLPEFVNMVRPLIYQHRTETETKYRELSIAGQLIPGEPDDWDKIISSDIPTITALRSWTSESIAQEHVDFAVLQANYITGTVEEQF
jgi:hypothetical protein